MNLLLVSFVHYWFWLPFSWQHILLIFRGALLVCGWGIYSMCNVDYDCAPTFIRQTVVTAQCFVCFVFNSWPSALHQISFWKFSFQGPGYVFHSALAGAGWVIWCITAYDECQDISLMLGGRTQSCTSFSLSASLTVLVLQQGLTSWEPFEHLHHRGLFSQARWRPWVQLSGLYHAFWLCWV